MICKLIHWEELEMKLVGTASNGIGALQMIEAEHPDLVMTDIRMPGYDGMELLKRARIQNPDMEFIIISGYSHFEYAQTAIRYGLSDYILKPVNEEALNATLQKVRQRYMEHQALTEKNLEQKKQQVLDQARVRETLWMDLEYARIPRNMEALNEKYWYHFQEEKFRTFLIQADVKNNENLSENYADNVMELVNSKVPGLFEKLKSALKAGLENMISTLCMELHAFEYMRFHLAVSGEVQDIGQ